MEIDVSGRHFHVTEALKQYALDKVEKLEKYSLKLESVHVVFEIQKFHHVAEVTVLGKKLRLVAKEESVDMYSAFDNAFGSIQLQMRRHHERLKEHKDRRWRRGQKKTDEIES